VDGVEEGVSLELGHHSLDDFERERTRTGRRSTPTSRQHALRLLLVGGWIKLGLK
jgi:hypothetical protein